MRHLTAAASFPPTPAENTSVRLQQASRGGWPVMIPGAFETRPRGASVQATASGAAPAPPQVADAAGNRERLEHEREGGGAPSERKGGRTIVARLFHFVLHPTGGSIDERRPLPAHR